MYRSDGTGPTARPPAPRRFPAVTARFRSVPTRPLLLAVPAMSPRTVLVAAAAVALAVPGAVRAQATPAPAAPPPPVVQVTPNNPACDCATGDDRSRGLRNLAAFAPLGFIGALAAAGAPVAVAEAPSKLTPTVPSMTIAEAVIDPTTIELPVVEAGRVTPDVLPKPDSLTEQGLRAPDTATPLPSVLLLGTGLLALGAFALARSRG